MDITQWYAVALGGLVAVSVISYLLLSIIRIAHTYTTIYFLKYLFYPQVHRYIRGKTTRFDAVLIVAFLVGNILCTTIGVKDIPSFTRRTGLMSTINLMPLSLGGHLNLVASRCGITFEDYSRIHRWLGWVAIAEGLVHAAAAASIQKLSLHTLPQIAALTAAIGMGTVLLFSTATVRRHLYEIFLKFHLVLAAIVVAAIWLHNRSKKLFESPIVYLLASICLWILMVTLQFSQILYRNLKYGKPLNRATVQTITFKRQNMKDIPISDAIHVRVTLSRPWNFRAGQFVYLCIPGVSRTAFIQSHPFYVSWWYRDLDDNYIVVFIIQRMGSFTRDLLLHASNDLTQYGEMKAIIEGPYGNELNLELYGTVLLFATGIGIAGQLPYVKQLLEGYHNCEVKTRRIALFWEMDSEFHSGWVADMMKELLERDTDRILDIKLFVLGNYISAQTRQGDIVSLGERLSKTYEAMDVEDLIRSEIRGRKGHTVISLCMDDEASNKIREIVRRMLDKTIHLKELEFRPYSSRTYGGRLTAMLNHRRVKRSIGGV
ncbi:MAG: hypothetical protein M1840_005510 [Geoglossum simile]|nr:MAG: hypothetical protein M1840_005510 [Geoglossum simile]